MVNDALNRRLISILEEVRSAGFESASCLVNKFKSLKLWRVNPRSLCLKFRAMHFETNLDK